LFSDSTISSTNGKIKFKRAATSNAAPRKKFKIKKADTNEEINQSSAGVPVTKVKRPFNIGKAGLKFKRTSLTRAKSRGKNISKDSIYGLDVDFLREIGKDDVVQV